MVLLADFLTKPKFLAKLCGFSSNPLFPGAQFYPNKTLVKIQASPRPRTVPNWWHHSPCSHVALPQPPAAMKTRSKTPHLSRHYPMSVQNNFFSLLRGRTPLMGWVFRVPPCKRQLPLSIHLGLLQSESAGRTRTATLGAGTPLPPSQHITYFYPLQRAKKRVGVFLQ